MKFDAYEYVGVIVPGVIVIVAITTLFPASLPFMTSSLTIGDLGLALILAFVVGHLLQAGGNLLERVIWSPLGGMPTTWPAKSNSNLLSNDQMNRLDASLNQDFSAGRETLLSGRGVMREIFARIRKSGKDDRIEKFNRNYGLMRGVAVAFIVTFILILFRSTSFWREAFLMLALAGIATYRMVRFGEHYAREIFAEYLSLSRDQDKELTASTSDYS